MMGRVRSKKKLISCKFPGGVTNRKRIGRVKNVCHAGRKSGKSLKGDRVEGQDETNGWSWVLKLSSSGRAGEGSKREKNRGSQGRVGVIYPNGKAV